jgi:hypothetical protein
MNATYNRAESWEKQSVWELDNGWRATESYSHYGEMIQRLDNPKGGYWHCSDGLDGLPDFAREWIEELRNEHGVFARLVRPRFRKVYP